jgi:hypothetical protein
MIRSKSEVKSYMKTQMNDDDFVVYLYFWGLDLENECCSTITWNDLCVIHNHKIFSRLCNNGWHLEYTLSPLFGNTCKPRREFKLICFIDSRYKTFRWHIAYISVHIYHWQPLPSQTRECQRLTNHHKSSRKALSFKMHCANNCYSSYQHSFKHLWPILLITRSTNYHSVET